MSSLHFILMYLWIGPHLLLGVVAWVMFRKGHHRQFPVFFTYLIYEFLLFCLLFGTYKLGIPPELYVKLDTYGRIGSIALHFGILRELFEAPVAHSMVLRRAMAQILNAVTGLLVLLAIVFVVSLYRSILSHRVYQAYVVIEALNAAQGGLVVLIFLWHRFLGLRMAPFVFGAAMGLGLVTGLDPLMQAWNDFLGAQNSMIARMTDMGVFQVAVFLWLFYASVRETTMSESKVALLPDLREQAAELGRVINL